MQSEEKLSGSGSTLPSQSDQAQFLSLKHSGEGEGDFQSTPQNIVRVDSQASEKDRRLVEAKSAKSAERDPAASMATTHTRRNANGTVGSVYSGNKIRHLKKEDGIPLWRKDIQLAFLQSVFKDETRCFTMPSDGSKGHTFADTYIDTMARSSKTSKVLKEKLLADRDGAMNMAMICLLVNVGRMNTTLNFFPEMRAQLRTFHAIPSLQAHQDPNAYKQLQDAPRLKSILKGASEDLNQPNTLNVLMELPAPRTNPVHLIFLLSQYAPKVSEAHFQPPRDFFDLVMRPTLSSKSRARAFLWLVWWYTESNFTAEDGLKNPFGKRQDGEGTDGLPLKVPPFDHLTEAQADAENVDTEEEIQYGEIKRLERRRILEEDETVGPPSKKQKKGHDEATISISDTAPTRSPSPSSAQRKVSTDRAGSGVTAPSPTDENGYLHNRYPNIASKPDLPNPPRLALKTKLETSTEVSSSPIPLASGHPARDVKRPRLETSHQKAVTNNRKLHVDHLLYKRMASHQVELRRAKRRNSSTFGMMVMNRLKELPDMYDTEDEDSWGPGGLVHDQNDLDDYGEEALRYKKVIDRAIRRLDRHSGAGSMAGLAQNYDRRKKVAHAQDADPRDRGAMAHKEHAPALRGAGRTPRAPQMGDEQLDDLDLELLGDNQDDDREDESGFDEASGGEGVYQKHNDYDTTQGSLGLQ